MKIKRKELIEYLLLLLFRITIDIIYEKIIYSHYKYQGFISDHSLGDFVISYIFILLGNIFIVKYISNKDIRVSKIVILVIYLLSFVPFTSMIMYGALDYSYTIGNLLYWMFIFLFYNSKFDFKLSLKLNKKMSNKFIYILGGLSVLVVVYISAKYTHFRFHFDFMTVYELRAESKEYNIPSLLSYLFSWSRTINSLMIAYSLLNKNVLSAALFGFAQLLSFGIDGMKTSIFLPLVVIVLYIFRERIAKINFTIWSSIGLVVVSIIAFLQNTIFHSYTIGYLFFYRAMFLPAKISSFYWDFFTHNTPDYFRSSFLRHIGFNSPYSDPAIPYMIAGKYLNDPTAAANNGLISDAVTNFGFLGIICMPFLLVLVLKIFDKCSEKHNSIIILCVAVQFAIILTNNFLTISLLTQGGLAMIIILLFMDSEYKQEPYRKIVSSI